MICVSLTYIPKRNWESDDFLTGSWWYELGWEPGYRYLRLCGVEISVCW